jgi:Family of unknown function (DUF5715)
MRVNAPIAAALALAALSLSAAPLHAHPTPIPHKTTAQTPHEIAVKKHPKKKSTPPAIAAKPKPKSKHRKHTETVDEDSLPTFVRIHKRKTVPAAKPATPATPKKATASDFLQAATTAIPEPPTTAHQPAQPAPHKSVSKPVPVVSVIRPTPAPPALPSIQAEAATPVILPSLYNKRGKLIVPRALKGSHEILLHQNEVADREGLDRIQDDEDILDLRRQNLLVPIPTSRVLLVDDRLPTDRRYCRPWAAKFLATMAGAYYARFHTPLQVNSAVRTVEFQQRLLRTNGNAAPAEGDTASPHLTGQAIDLAKHGLTITEIAWLRAYLLPLVQQSKIDVEEEFQQACFHISVYKKYAPAPVLPRRNLATTRHPEPEAAAATPTVD